MKSVLISINPKWCQLIARGEKTVEVRKTKPKIDEPFKCYIYETKAYDTLFGKGKPKKLCVGGGKVIGEFVCDEITGFYPTLDLKELNFRHFQMVDNSQVNMRDLYNYANGKYLYGWHISDLVIYDKPKELREFWNADKCPYASEEGCTYKLYCYRAGQTKRCGSTLTRPPQSWRYVERKEDENEKKNVHSV